MRFAALTFVILAAITGCDYDPWEESERKRLRKQQAEYEQYKEALLPILFQSQAELAVALNGRDPKNLTVAEQAELHHLGKKFEGAQYAIDYVNGRIADVQTQLDQLDRD